MMCPMIDRVLDHFVARRFNDNLSACEQSPGRHQVLVSSLLQRRTQVSGSLVERLQQFFARVHAFLFHLGAVCGSYIQFVLVDLHVDPHRNRRNHVRESSEYHDKSMIFGALANMVATIPMWINMEINQDELDVAPTDGSKMEQKRMDSSEELLKALDKTAADLRSALEKTTDEHLMTSWRLLARGQVVIEAPRYEMIQDTINHWAHHRGQMTVYLRLMGAKVPALYGPSADDARF